MKKVIATLLTLCMIWVVVPTTATVPAGDEGISTYEYFYQDQVN